MWVMVPSALVSGGGLPVPGALEGPPAGGAAVLVVMVPAVIVAERHDKPAGVQCRHRPVSPSQIGLWLFGDGLIPLALLLTLFFISFNVLEATQPS